MATKSAAGNHVWVIQQHDQFSVVESKEIPSTKVEAGERMKAVFGPYGSRAAAEEIIQTMQGRTLRGKREGK